MTKLAIPSNQTKFPLYTFVQPHLFIISATATTGYVKVRSDVYHHLPVPRCPGHHVVSSLSVFQPQEIKSLTSLSLTKSCCQKENHSSAVTYGEKRERTSLGGETAREEERMVALAPWADEGCQDLGTFHPHASRIHSPGRLTEESTCEASQQVRLQEAPLPSARWLSGLHFSFLGGCWREAPCG